MKEYIEYELIYIVPINNFEKVDLIKKEIKEIIEDNEGKIIKESEPQKRKLAYPIKGRRNGAYFINRILIEKEKIKKMEKGLKVKTKEDILRYMLVKADSLPSLEEEEKFPKEETVGKTTEVKKEVEEIGSKTELKPTEIETEVKAKVEVETEKDTTEEEKGKKESVTIPAPKKTETQEKAEIHLKKDEQGQETEGVKEVEEVKEKEEKTEEKEPAKKKIVPSKEKMKFEDLDKKIDEILKDDLI